MVKNTEYQFIKNNYKIQGFEKYENEVWGKKYEENCFKKL